MKPRKEPTPSQSPLDIDAASTTMPRVGEVCVALTRVAVWEEGSHGKIDEHGMQWVFGMIIKGLAARGWEVERDARTATNYPTLSNYHWVARKGDLCAVMDTGGRTASVEFHHEGSTSVVNGLSHNTNGGRYNFDKFQRMSTYLQRQCVVEMGYVVKGLLALGYLPQPESKLRIDALNMSILRICQDRRDASDPLAYFNNSWTRSRFKRDEAGWPVFAEYGSYNKDRDGQQLLNGQVKHFRYRGRLMRATVYTNLNSMWLAFYGGTVWSCSGHELFTCNDPTLEPRRLVPGQANRIKVELEKALKTSNYKRVSVLAKVLEKLTATTGDK